ENTRDEEVDLIAGGDGADAVVDDVGVAEGPTVLLAPTLVDLLGSLTVVEVLAQDVDGGAKFAESDRSPERVDGFVTEVLAGEVVDDLVVPEEFGDGRRDRFGAELTEVDAAVVDPKGDVLTVGPLAGDR